MRDIEFDCPVCSTPLVVDDAISNRLIAAPSRGKQLGGPVRIQTEPAQAQPIAPGHRQNYRDHEIGITLRTRNCTLAYIAFILVCISPVTALILLIPGIICGHLALGQCNRDPNLTGRPFAVAALIVGYIFVGVVALILLGLVWLLFAVI